MSEREPYYITTPIYYVSGDPHVGTAYTTIAGDAAARFQRMKGKDVFYLTGTDEHGQKIYNAANERDKTPQQLADELVPKFKELWDHLNITHDYFIRTTDDEHEEAVKAFFERLDENDDIYKGMYRGWYCTHCESYIKGADSDDNLCDDCGRPGEYLEEENYFFRLSKYEEDLKQFFEEHPDFLRPESRRNEMLSRIDEGLEDISVSRSSFDWGVPLPKDRDHVIWVWFDALINYISALGFPENEEKLDKYWPTATHLIGKEIVWFHSVVWPAMLMAADLEPPKQIYAHGWWTMNAEKLSKSKGNVIYPRDITEDFGVDPLRYFMLREVPFGQDGDFSYQNFVDRYNHDLGNDLGNLLYRVESMLEKYRDGQIPEPGEPEEEDEKLKEAMNSAIENLDNHMENLQFDRALKAIWEPVQVANQYAEWTQPWELAKKDEKENRLNTVLYRMADALHSLSVMLKPFMPERMQEMRKQLNVSDESEQPQFPADARPNSLESGITIEKGDPLFPRHSD